ncbi:TIGR02285 family protein [Pseudomonas sp. BT-42-2]|uniref:TIGR02285 family protein n=1 Tax=Pseudomonas sp. BT-42-2 TaxID=2986927 RepID=UPI0021F77A60|nr:TIGR02285 family protein [Pseudomonas sp. BT-42-2]MCV9921782.1 TIGR02285 family protein [Pseudomonas sp. BT-42-2]
MRASRLLRPLILLCALLPVIAEAKERLLWLVRDLPPFTIFEGPEKGQGVIDRMLPMLIEQMPEYDHSIVRVNRARGIQMLQEPSFTCDPTLLWTPERAKYALFSKPTLGVLSSGVVVRKQDQAGVEPFLDAQEVDLKQLLAETRLKLGIVAERSYSAQVDDILRQLPDSAFSRHYGNDATASLLQMQQLGRLQLVLGYWPEVRYLIQQQGGRLDDYLFYPIQGVNPYQFLHVACSDTPLGREAIAHIDQLLPALRRNTLPQLYAHWLDPQLREGYLQQARQLSEQTLPNATPQP